MASPSVIPSIEGYIIAEKLGTGSYGEVFKAFKKDGKKDVVAIKCVAFDKLSPSAKDNIISEIGILKKLNHDNIVKLKNFTWDKTHIYIIMEYCSGGNLHALIREKRRLRESVCKKFLQQLALALSYLRERNISHFDLKPQNIFIASRKMPILKIGDFGLAQYVTDHDTNSSLKGSPLYMAPEIIKKREYDAKADIWSIGIILYECLFGRAPYSSKSFDELINKIKDSTPINIPLSSSISSECRDFLRQCLEQEPSKRIGFSDFFAHPFIDLEHAPHSKSLEKATSLITAALKDEESGKIDGAFTNYNEAIKYLVPVMEAESEDDKKSSLRKKIHSYINHMEDIKSIRDKDTTNFAETNVNSQSSFCPNTEYITKELLRLAKTTPSISTAVEIGQMAELYEQENSLNAALEKYEMALGKLLIIIQAEPKGKRRELLLDITKKWMTQAETVKALLESELNNQSFATADQENTCSLQ